MRYSIGDVSRVLGLTPGALHFYEREGIIEASKEKSNGRRYYTQADVIRLISCRKYRSMNISLKTIAQQFSSQGDSLAIISDRLEKHCKEAQRKSAYYNALAQEISAFATQIEQMPEQIGHFRVCSSPDVWMMKLEDGLLSHHKKEQVCAQRWLDAMPATRVSMLLSPDESDAQFCYTIQPDQAELFQLDVSKHNVLHIPDQMSIYTVVKDERINDDPRCAFEPVLDYMHAHGFEPTGYAWGRIVVVDCSKGRLDICAQVWVPFK